ncbi:MAG TPA: four helix bundle protein [Opitutales bacterium]|nr:four helix bundle protein [Opitutales bacterium]
MLAWQRAVDLVVAVYQSTESFPKDELFGLVSQLRRAAVSIPSNLAEGFGRRSRTDYARFMLLSMGSLFEVQTQLEIALRLKYLFPESFERLTKLSREVEYLLSRLREKMLASASKTA